MPRLPDPRSATVHRLMRQHGISVKEISADAGINPHFVRVALDYTRFAHCSFMLIAAVHGSVERKLRERGWSGDSKQLWDEFDRRLPVSHTAADSPHDPR